MSSIPLVSDTAMVMAAGLGTRMRPLTLTRPKPLVEVAGKALVDHALDSLAEAGMARAVVNVHYFADLMEAHLETRQHPECIVSDERELLLDTGGGLVKAHRGGLLPDPCFCLNSDNIWIDGPVDAFRELSLAWDADRMDALLLLVPHARAHNYAARGDFHADALGLISRRRGDEVAPFIYTGIQLVSHRLLREPPEGAFSTNVLWSRAIEEGRLFGTVFSGEWFEVGEPWAIAPTEAALTRG